MEVFTPLKHSRNIFKLTSTLYSPQFTYLWPHTPCECIPISNNKIRVSYHQHSAPKSDQAIPQVHPGTPTQQWVKYNESWSISAHLFLATDGSYIKPFNNSAYIISDNKGNKILYGNISPQSAPLLRSSYDAEIYAVILGLEQLVWLQETSSAWSSVTVIIDNKAVIHRTTEILERRTFDYMTNEYDMLTKLQFLMSSIKNSVQVIWKPSHTGCSSLYASLNADADKLAQVSSLSQRHVSISDVNSPYSTSEASIWMNKVPITYKIVSSIRISISLKNIKNYLHQKFAWSKHTITDLRFDLCTSAMQIRSPYEVVQINKLLYNWAPLNSRLNIFSPSSSSKCSKCTAQEETFQHFIQCPHWNSKINWKKFY